MITKQEIKQAKHENLLPSYHIFAQQDDPQIFKWQGTDISRHTSQVSTAVDI